MNFEKVKSLLHLARKGRMLEIGRYAVSVLIKRRKAALVIVAMDASVKIKHEIEIECRRNNVPIYILSTKEKLGEILGRETVAVIGISDKNLAEGLKAHLV